MKWTTTKDSRIKKRGDIYYARFSKRGIRVEDSLFTSNFELAKDLTNKIERAILSDEDYKAILSGASENKTDLIDDLYPLFISDKSKGNPKLKIQKVREKTLGEYVNFYERYFKDFWGEKSLEEITADEWEKYIDHARAKSVKKDKLKIFNHWKIMSAFCSWCIATDRLVKMPGIYNPDPVTFQDELEDEDGIGKNLTDSQLLDLRNKIENNMALELYVSCAIYMGMRSSEITQLKKDRLDFKNNLIKLRASDTKTKQARSVPIHSVVFTLLKAQCHVTESSEYLFPNRVDKSRPMDRTGFKKSWYALLETCKIDCRFHDLRHSYATRVFGDPSINPVVACKSLGMSMKTAMKHYIHFSEEQLSSLNKFEIKEN